MPGEKRKVLKDGVSFRGLKFWTSRFSGLVGETVEVCQFPHELRCVEVFHEGEFLATAEPTGTASADEVHALRERRRQDKRRSSELRPARLSRF